MGKMLKVRVPGASWRLRLFMCSGETSLRGEESLYDIYACSILELPSFTSSCPCPFRPRPGWPGQSASPSGPSCRHLHHRQSPNRQIRPCRRTSWRTLTVGRNHHWRRYPGARGSTRGGCGCRG